MKSKICYTKPSITELEVGYATDAAANGWGEQCYAYIDKFESTFKDYLSVDYAIATSSCTGAMHMGLAALGIGAGDEVILADINWIATASPIVHLGATPVFVDILSDTWCIDPKKAELAITSQTKAIIATHIYGNLCDMKALLAIGEKYDIAIIEDAAEAIGSVYVDKKAGSMGRFGTFSFHGTKTLTTGEGGMFVTNDQTLYEHVLSLSNHGRVKGQTKQFWPDLVGYKYKMSNIQAAIGCAQMERIELLTARKREILAGYRFLLQDVEGVSLNAEPEEGYNGAWMPTVVFDKTLTISRELLIEAFRAVNIDARVFFWPLSSLPMFQGHPPCPMAYDISSRAINLPSYHDITIADQRRVIDVIKGLI
ncbi:UDP-4-amino-4-deoxy-L-arabinose--oxoglutarate aminotransferase [Shewanella putrefaciens]|nr:UDP-4-amino-4-deoxy-L-arabinose--oxoglutarate aminotransferase [Shewanella putrefaciens]